MPELEIPNAYRLIPTEQWVRIVAVLRQVATDPAVIVQMQGIAAPRCAYCLVWEGEHARDCPVTLSRALLDDLGETNGPHD